MLTKLQKDSTRKDRIATAITSQPGYARLSSNALESLVQSARILLPRACTRVLCEGDQVDAVYWVAEGHLRVEQTSSSGKRHVVRFVKPGDSFGEAAAFSAVPLPVDIWTVCDATVVTVPVRILTSLMATDETMRAAVISALSSAQYESVKHLRDLVLKDAPARVAGHLLSLCSNGKVLTPCVSLGVPKQDIARHLNLTSETLSRILRRLTEANILVETSDAAHVQIRDVDRLRALSDE